MPLNDFLGIGKILPIDKLIDVVSSSVGRLSKSYFDKKDAETKAYEIRKLAEARAEEMKIMSNAVRENFQITGGIEYKDEKIAISSPKYFPIETKQIDCTPFENNDLQERTAQRINYQENRKQLNIENVTAFAAEELQNEQPIDNNPIDEDWTTRFFNIAEDISSEEMQALWGKILAGEIKQPKSYSLRTLEILKNLSKEEAEVFMKFAQAKVTANRHQFIYNPNNGKLIEEKFNITFSDRLLLTELGLISSENNLEFSLSVQKGTSGKALFNYGSKGILLERQVDTPKQAIEVLLFTKTGLELSRLIKQEANIDYINAVCASFNHEKVKIEYGDLFTLPNGQIMLLNKVEYKKE